MTAFALLVTTFGLNQLALHAGYSIPFTAFYLDDLLCLPIVLSIIQYVQRKRYGLQFKLPLSHVIISVAFITVVFEAVLPAVSTRFRGDLFDVLFYTVGGTLFYGFNNKNIKKAQNTSNPSLNRIFSTNI